ncbi:hypothetical protein L6E12_06550 [Actinokineospora sp. PR83]|uniref:WXG100 family type VII secretion target n=1 Tax=Actinokineospora sp. PR83 TaxID=2884908 RepID=UPI001F3315EC|nr:hypothetical protein [Actinokineospora sp. PR83]MCG8915444.1 hypothetical protein [Actinokineospora sp. PR83]
MGYADTADPIAALNNEANLQGGPSISDAISEAGVQVQVVNWIWEKVVGDDLVTSLIAPITGDFEKIATTGKQWDNVCDALQAVRDNLNTGLDELDPHWDGAAADAFALRIRTMWTVAIEADAQAAKLVGTAFEKVADASKKACDQALKLIKKLVNKLLEAIALLPIPVVGWAKAVKTVIDAIEIYNAVMTIINGIKAIIEGCKSVVQGVQDLGSAIGKIKDIRNVNDAINSANDISDARDDINAGKDQAAGGLKTTAKGAVSAGKNGYKANKHYGEYQQERNPAPAPAPEPEPAAS